MAIVQLPDSSLPRPRNPPPSIVLFPAHSLKEHKLSQVDTYGVVLFIIPRHPVYTYLFMRARTVVDIVRHSWRQRSVRVAEAAPRASGRIKVIAFRGNGESCRRAYDTASESSI